MQRSPQRPSNVAGMLLAGRYLWRSNPEDPGQPVDVTWEEGAAVARIAGGEDAGEVVPVAGMGGSFDRV